MHLKMLGITFTAEKQVFIIKHYFRMESYKKVIQQFQNKFLGSSVPNKNTMRHRVNNYLNNYTLEPKKKARKKTKLTPERLSNIRDRLKKISKHTGKNSCFTTWYPSFYCICCFKRLKLYVWSYSDERTETTGSIKMFLEKQVCNLKKLVYGMHYEELVLVVRFFSHRRPMLTCIKTSSPSLFCF